MGKSEHMEAGDLVILVDDQGRWCGAYVYVGPDDADPERAFVRKDDAADEYFVALRSHLRRPIARASEAPSLRGTANETPRTITAKQRRRLFAIAKKLGMDTDALREATPEGSISALTERQADELIARLSAGTAVPIEGISSQGTATKKQLAFISQLTNEIGFSEDQFIGWVSARFGVNAFCEISEKQLASKIIGGLMAMRDKRQAQAEAGHPWTPGRRKRTVGE